MKWIAGFALFCFTAPAIADGWADLGGINRKGERVSVYPASLDAGDSAPAVEGQFKVLVYLDGKRLSVPKTYVQACFFKNDRLGNRIAFECKKGKSPLAGATYRIVENEDPDNCEYAAVYVCVAGCRSDRTPITMVHSWWECGI